MSGIYKMDEISHLLNKVRNALPDIEIRQNEPMKEYTSFKIGGPVRAMLFPEKEESIVKLCKMCHETSLVPLIMGNGSNLLVADKNLDRVVINTSRLNSIAFTEMVSECGSIHESHSKFFQESSHTTTPESFVYIKAGAGAILAAIAVFALENELTGFEFAHGIPGSLGGAVVMNAGAYGGEMKDVTHITRAYGNKTGLCEIHDEEHGFSYRYSRFSQSGEFIISSVIRLKKGNRAEIKRKMDELSAKRRASQPLDMPSAGSTFKRPKNGYAAELIDRAGLRGYSIGAAEVSRKHAGFIVNRGTATFDDTIRLINHVTETVYKEFNITLEPEVKIFS